MNQSADPASFLQIGYRPDNQLLIGRWQRSVSDPEMQTGYQALAQAARESGCHRWLIDSRRRTNRTINGPEWVLSTFLPELQRELGGPLAVAFLVLPEHLASVAADKANEELHARIVPHLQFARFMDEGLANAWLDKTLPAGSW